jgi:hypothetical protein
MVNIKVQLEYHYLNPARFKFLRADDQIQRITRSHSSRAKNETVPW